MLSQDEKRILLAKHFGWTDIHGGPPAGAFWRGTNPKRPLGLKEEIPDYFNDLNACREVLLSMDDDETLNHMLKHTGLSKWTIASAVMTANASQHAEAFGQNLNLW